jgi:nicotinamidase-related amidase
MSQEWRLNSNKAGLLVIDVQERLVPSIHEGDRVLKKIIQAVKAAQTLHLPLWITEQMPEKLGGTVSELKAVLTSYQPIPKSDFSVASVFPPESPRTLLVCGLETHICVRQSVYDLRAAGKEIYLLGDAVGSRSPLDTELALREMQGDKTLILSVEAALLEMVRGAKDPKFKSILEIIK